MLINNQAIKTNPKNQLNKSTWIGAIFGIWLSGIFAASLTGNMLSGNRNIITIHNNQDSKLNIVLLLFAVLWPITYFAFSKNRFIPYPINRSCLFSLLTFLFFSMISIFFSAVMLTSTAYWLLTIFSIWICLQFISSLNLKQIELGLKIYAVLLSGLMTGFSIWEYVPGVRLGEGHRILEPAMIGMISLSAIMAAMAIRWKLIRFSLIAILLLIVYLTGSRAPTLAAILGIITISHLRTKASGTALKLIIYFCVIVCIISFAAFSDEILPFIDDFLGLHNKHRGIDSGGSGRLGIWKETWQLFIDNPAFGVGFRGHEARLTLGSSSHNGYLAMLAEIGLIGFLGIIFIIISSILKLRSSLKKSKELTYIYSIFIGVCYSYLFLAIFERYLINSGNPTSVLFLVSILWPTVISKRTMPENSITTLNIN